MILGNFLVNSFDHQAVVRHSSGSCQAVVRHFSGSRQAVVRQPSGSRQVVVRQSSGSQAISNLFIENPWDCKFIHCAAHGAERLFVLYVKIEIMSFFSEHIVLTQHKKVQTENISFWEPLLFSMNEWIHKNRQEYKVDRFYIRYLSRFFDCLVHPNLSATLGTGQKWR